MASDGSAVRPATDAEARQVSASPPTGETLVFASAGTPYGAPLFLIDAQGRHRLIDYSAYALTQAALSPDGSTAVFAEWLGEHNAQSVTLYAVPTNGSTEPRRLTPTSCTSSAGGPLGGKCLDGTDGSDTLVGTKYGDLVIAGSGNDIIRAGDGDNWVEAQWGNDDIRTGSGSDHVWGGAGNDVIRT